MRVDGSWVATGLLGLALVVGSNAPAAASWQQPVLSVSPDGEHWSPSLGTPLFDETRRWVPGDSRTVALWVQDLSGRPGELELSVVGRGSPRGSSGDPWTARAGNVLVSGRVDGQPLRLGGDDLVQLTGDAPTTVEVTVTMPRSTTDDAQGARTGLVLLARLVDDPVQQSTLPGLGQEVGGPQDAGLRSLPFGLPLTVLALLVSARAAVRGRRNLRRHLRRTHEPIA